MLVCSPIRILAGPPDFDSVEFFEKRVRPLLHEQCFKCHSGPKPKAGLTLTSRSDLLKGGVSGPAALAGNAKHSLMIQALHYDEALKMPPNKKLPDEAVADLTRWIEIGLPWPAAQAANPMQAPREAKFQISEEQRRFWSFQKVRPVSPPYTKDASWPRNAIDSFILQALGARGLEPADPAQRHQLIRRATFDLIGLPPTPDEVAKFVADQSPDAFVKVVDRLLASPHYGERWGRHWLDLVRYADSFDARITTGAGSEMDVTEAWRYRDWVVTALNLDMPYDSFVVNQIAGDLLPAATPEGINAEGIIATGMLAIGNWGGGDADKEKLLTDIADDQVDVVSRSFLGLTVACARCHDHKFDPISTADYYGLAGIFFSTHILPNVGPKTNGPPMLRIPLLTKAESEHRATTATGKGDAKKKATNPVPMANGAQDGGVPESPHAGVHDVRLHIRGSYTRLGEPVRRRFPTILAGEHQAPIIEGSGRLPLARWIASPDNPLTARVVVNRLWQFHFGEGIVRTPSNFGKLGERPTHPALLDYLAQELVRSNWSLKQIHRLIMLSSTYQLSSARSKEAERLDPENRLFGRANRRRLEAEELRDSLLAVSGSLSGSMRGPATRDFANPKRTLYQMTIRSDRSGFGPLFDAADSTAPVEKRTASTVAPQALFMLNHPFVQDCARRLAARACSIDPTSDIARIHGPYVLLYGRSPTRDEIDIGVKYLKAVDSSGSTATAGWTEYCQMLLCTNEFVHLD
jgi:hypothetical protein